jgi:hypothetical protein
VTIGAFHLVQIWTRRTEKEKPALSESPSR